MFCSEAELTNMMPLSPFLRGKQTKNQQANIVEKKEEL